MTAPDKIFAIETFRDGPEPERTWLPDTEGVSNYLLATPAREIAEELVEAVRFYACGCGDECEQLNGTCTASLRDLVAKLEESK